MERRIIVTDRRQILISDAGQQIVTDDLPVGDGYFVPGKWLVSRLQEMTSAQMVRRITRRIDLARYVQYSPAILVALVHDAPYDASTHSGDANLIEQRWAVGVLVQAVDDAADAAFDAADRLIEEILDAVPGWVPAIGRAPFIRVQSSNPIQYGDNYMLFPLEFSTRFGVITEQV